MSVGETYSEPTLLAAEKVAAILARAGIDSVLIGAAALAVHGYPRATQDLDLATCVEPKRLAAVAPDLRREGFSAEMSLPDGNDPLGGVLRVGAEGIDPIEIVNFSNPPAHGFPALLGVALQDAVPYRTGTSLRVVSLPHLVVFKLYAGGLGSKTDVLELLNRNPDVDLKALQDMCRRFRLDRRLEAWLRELQASSDE